MWKRLEELCEALAAADQASTFALWTEVNGGVLERACRSALADGARALPTLARCLDLLTGESLIRRLTPHLEAIRKYDSDEVEDILRDARKTILGGILASLAMRCAGGEPVGSELLQWASHCSSYNNAAEGDLTPSRPFRPYSWIEAAIESLHQANPKQARFWGGNSRFRTLLRLELEPAMLRLQQHHLEEFLQGANPAHISALERLLAACPLRDIYDLYQVLAGQGEAHLASWCGYRMPLEDCLTLPGLIASDDLRVRLIAILMVPKALNTTSTHTGDAISDQFLSDLLQALDVARSHGDPLVSSLAVCAAIRIGQPAISPELAVRLLGNRQPVVRAAAAQTIGHMAGEAIWAHELAPLLADPAASVRFAAAEAVGRLGKSVAIPVVLTGLLPLLEDDDLEIRQVAIEAAEALGPALTQAFVDRLTDLTTDASEYVRMRSIWALGAANPIACSQPVYSALFDCLDDVDTCVQECALRAYTKLRGPADPAVLARVSAMLEDRRKGIRQAAAELLAQIGPVEG